MGRRDFKFKNRDNEQMSKAISDDNFWTNYEMTAEEYQMRVAISPHHTNPRSTTLDFWRKTTDIERYRVIQAQKKKQINIPTRFVTFRLFILKIFELKFRIEGSNF